MYCIYESIRSQGPHKWPVMLVLIKCFVNCNQSIWNSVPPNSSAFLITYSCVSLTTHAHYSFRRRSRRSVRFFVDIRRSDPAYDNHIMAYPRYNDYEQRVPPAQPAAYYSAPSTSALPSREPLSREPHRVLFAGLPPDITANDLRVSVLPFLNDIFWCRIYPS